jgi:hypothetical protein
MSLLTPPTTPDDICEEPLFTENLKLLVLNKYTNIEFRGALTHNELKIKVEDIISHFNLDKNYLRTVNKYLVTYSLSDLYNQDFSSISSISDPTLFHEYKKSYELYIKYKGLNILAFNVPELVPLRDWLETILDEDLNCYEKIDYDYLRW